jgi:hypothetical protein
MTAYASKHVCVVAYRRIICSLLNFWQPAEPGSRNLPGIYYQFLAAYRQALTQDE